MMATRIVVFAVLGLLPLYVVHASTVWVEGNVEQVAATGDGRFGGCMAELDVELADAGLACPGRWVTFGCAGEYAETRAAGAVFESLRAAVVAGRSVGMRVTDEKQDGGYCHASRIKIQDEPHIDEDSDADGVLDLDDDVPLDASETVDTDDDGIGNNADADDDNDGVNDADDAFPLDPDEYADSDGDGIGDNADPDDDNDGIPDERDTRTIALDAANEGASGIAHAAGRLYVVDWSDERVYVYGTDGRRESALDFDLDVDFTTSPDGVTYADGRLYVVNGGTHLTGPLLVAAYDTTGAVAATHNFDLDAEFNTAGIAFGNGRFFVVDSFDDRVTAYTRGGERRAASDFELAAANSEPVGITFANGRLYVIDDADGKVYAYSASGEREAGFDFVLDAGNAGASGMTYADGAFYVVDSRADSIYVYPAHREALAGLSTPTPWHLTNVWIDFSHAPEDIDSYCVTFSLDADVPDDVNLYIASFQSTINKVSFYGGIQTRIHGRERKEDSAPVVKKRRGAIFSRWRERDWGAIEQASGGLADSSGHEGDFIGVRNDYSWGEGSHEICLRKGAVVEGDPLPDDYEVEDLEFGWGRFVHTWVRMEVTDMASGATTFVGALAFPGRSVSLGRSIVMFVEIYDNPSPFPALDVPQFTVSFENFQVDGEDLPYERVTDTSNANLTETAGVPKLAYASYDASRGVIDVDVGKFVGEFGKILTVHDTATESVNIIETIAGQTDIDGRPATDVFLSPSSVAVDLMGNVYIAESFNDRVRRVDPAGTISTLAGAGVQGFQGHTGPAAEARLDRPSGVAVDTAGNVYISEIGGTDWIRRVDAATGVISTFAGTGATGFGGDGGPAAEAVFDSPQSVAVDGAGNVYVADHDNNRIRRIDAATGIVETFAGSDTDSTVGDFGGDGGPASEAFLRWPEGVAVDGNGNVYIADTHNHRVRRVDAATGIISTVAGSGETGSGGGAFDGDGGPAVDARLNYPSSVALDAVGDLFIGDSANHRVRRVDADTGIISTFAGTGERGYGGDGGPAVEALLRSPGDIAVDAVGDVYIVDNVRVRRVDADTGVISTLAGRGGIGDGDVAVDARLSSPEGLAMDAAGNLYVVDRSERVRRIDAQTSRISTFAGGGGFRGDGVPAVDARLSPRDVAVDTAGNVYIADSSQDRVKRVDVATGLISTFAGSGRYGFGGDGGQAADAQFREPTGVALDSAGNVYIADRYNHRIRRVDAASGVISTFAGTGANGFGGDGGVAIEARLSWPERVAVDGADNVYIVDRSNDRIRRVEADTGVISTFAGTGASDFGGDGGPAAEALLDSPADVAVDAAGNVYIADERNHRVRRVDAVTGTISTVAGSGDSSYFGGAFGGDGGPADEARLDAPKGVAVDASGNVYVSDTGNYLIRRVSQSGTTPASSTADATTPWRDTSPY